MPSKKDLWNTISLTPLTGVLDTRSRPADIPQGGFRWKQNFAVTPESKLCRRGGFNRFFDDYRYTSDGVLIPNPSPSDIYHNHDFHSQGQSRTPITLLFESTANDGTRRLYVGTQNGVWMLNQDTGEYTQITTTLNPLGATGTRWHAAELQDMVLFTNNYNPPWSWNRTTSVAHFVPTLVGAPNNVTAAAVIIAWNGFMFVMNVVQDPVKPGDRQSSRVLWSDINLPESWDKTALDTLAGFQDLDYGDDILAAAPLLGALYIFTRRSIWRVTPSADTTSTFTFTKVYSEPKNQTGCIAFPDTLVSTGTDLYYMGRDGIYRYNPYIPASEREDWLHRADGLIYRKLDTQLDGDYALSPVAEYSPTNREIWFSWPSIGAKGVNNWTLVAQIEQKTADVVDHGFTAFANFRRTPVSPQQANEVQDFLGASGQDWAIKSMGGVFYREFYPVALDTNGLPTPDIQEQTQTQRKGYYSILRGIVPLGLTDREKKIRKLLIDHDTSEQDVPCVVQLRIGNSFSLVDANDTDTTCAPQWRVIKFDGANGIANPALQCPDMMKLPAMQQAGLRPGKGMAWPMLETGRWLYFEIMIMNSDGSPAVGGDSCWQQIAFDALAMVKP